MARYDEGFKAEVVQAYFSGSGGYQTLGKKYDVDSSVVRQWVRRYKEHGDAGLRKKFSHYSAEFKLSVLEQMRQQELSLQKTAVLFDLRGGAGVVSGWQRRYHAGGIRALEPKPQGPSVKMKTPKIPKTKEADSAPTEQSRTVQELRRENEYLRAEVAYLKKLDALVRAQKHAAPTKRKP